METIVTLLIPALLGVLAFRLMMLPMGWLLRSAVHALCGFLCLLSLNAVSAFTGILIPMNAVTVAVAGFLGIPGIAVLILLQL